MPGLYIHFPFCRRKCPYCDFYSVKDLSLVDFWLEGLKLEILAAKDSWQNKLFDTIYIGGGSPSLLEPFKLQLLLKLLGNFNFAESMEFTIEANPEDMNENLVLEWLNCGINRVSLGVQSFDERWLGKKFLSRGHNLETIENAIELLVNSKLNFNLDLIYGHFGQSLDDWAEDLNIVSQKKASHISTYALTAEKGSDFEKAITSGKRFPLASEKLVSEMFLQASKILSESGYYRYEVSNFALPHEESKHNLKYWHHEPYLALGPSAHSFDGHKRWANFSSLIQWGECLKQNKLPLAFCETLTCDALKLEKIMLGLRLSEGVSEKDFMSLNKCSEYVESGYLRYENGRYKPTEKGFLAADRLALELS